MSDAPIDQGLRGYNEWLLYWQIYGEEINVFLPTRRSKFKEIMFVNPAQTTSMKFHEYKIQVYRHILSQTSAFRLVHKNRKTYSLLAPSVRTDQ